MPSQYQESKNGLLLTGLTRNTTPVGLQYPLQPDGKQASLETSLQYANPEQLNATQYQEDVLSGAARQQPTNLQRGYYTNRNPYTSGEAYDGSGNAQDQQTQSTSQRTTQGQGVAAPQSLTGWTHSWQDGQSTNSPARQTPTQTFWYCCHCHHGPYNVALHDTCVAVCGRVKCGNCRIEELK